MSGITYVTDGRGDIPRVARRRLSAGDVASTAPTVSARAIAAGTGAGNIVLTLNQACKVQRNSNRFRVIVDGDVKLMTGAVTQVDTTHVALAAQADFSAGETVTVQYLGGDGCIIASDDGAPLSPFAATAVTNSLT